MKDKIKLNSKQMKIVIVVITVVIILLAYFLVFQKNMDSVSELDDETQQLETQITAIQSLVPQLSKLEATLPAKQKEMEKYISKFQPVITQEKILFNIYDMSVDSKVKINSVAPAAVNTFFQANKVGITTPKTTTDLTTAVTSGQYKKDMEAAIKKAQQATNEKKQLSAMVGSVTSYGVSFTGTYNHVMEALDWVSKNKNENMSLGNVSLTFNSAEGTVTCECNINFFGMEGNGRNYEAPKTTDFSFGVNKIFGSAQK